MVGGGEEGGAEGVVLGAEPVSELAVGGEARLGIDEGRSWNGWHHHVTLVMLAHAFLTVETLRSNKNFRVDPAEDPA